MSNQGFNRFEEEPRAYFRAVIEADEYVRPLIHDALLECVPSGSYAQIKDVLQLSRPTDPVLQILPYERIDFEHILENPATSLANSYVIRKALIRKHHLWHTVSSWLAKHPEDIALKGQ